MHAARPSWFAKVLMLSALPAFLIGIPMVRTLGHLGVNEVWAFMLAMPLLIAAWHYLLGWLIDRTSDWIAKAATPNHGNHA